ncbi:MAG: metallophosphoesterase [bacterium]
MNLGRRFLTFLYASLLLTLTFTVPVQPEQRVEKSAEALSPTADFPRSLRFLTGEPNLEILPDGRVIAHVYLTSTCQGGEGFIGVFPEQAELKYPIYRVRGDFSFAARSFTEQIDSTALQFHFELKDLEKDWADINRFQERGGGTVALRFRLWADELLTFDRLFAYRRDAGGFYHRAPALIEGPFMDCVSDTSVTLSWEFDLPVFCRLEGKALGTPRDFPTPERRHEILLSDLAADQVYGYRIVWYSDGISFSSEAQFRTAPPLGAETPFRFAILCDSRASFGGGEDAVEGVSQGVLRKLLYQAYNQGVSFILFPGDLVSGSTSDPVALENQLRSWKRATAAVGGRIPIYEGMGNHDFTFRYLSETNRGAYISRSGSEAGEALFAKHFVNPVNSPDPVHPDAPPYQENVYSFDWGNSHFVMLNSNYFEKGGDPAVAHLPGEIQGMLRAEQLDWLEADLREARQRGMKHLFVATHEPAFPNGGHSKDAMWWRGQRPEMIEMRNRFWGILCRYGVLAAFFGHDHNYSRALIDTSVNPAFDPPIWQITTGGAGAPTYTQEHNVPWAEAVQAFYPLHHLVMIEVAGDRVKLTALSPEGTVIETADLTNRQ